jgi:hypothetical protein
MKRTSCFALLLFFICSLSAQTLTPGFVILNPRSVTNLSDFVYALKHNDLDKYRHADHRTTIHFTEGLNVELLSGSEMLAAGLPVDMSKVNTTNIDRTRYSQFSLHSSGRILISVSPLTPKMIKQGL